MKSIVAAALVIISCTALGKTIESTTSSVDLKGERPSCEMLGWRWVKSYSRVVENAEFVGKILKTEDYETLDVLSSRLPEGNPEGSEEKVEQVLNFKVNQVTKDNFKIIKVKTASFEWQNLTENFTDWINIEAKDGVVVVKTKIDYADWCFYPETSEIEAEVDGEKITLVWSTQKKKVKKYFKLMQRQ